MVNYDLERGITVFTSSGGSGQEEGPEKTKSQFIIAEAMPADSGNYTCKPSNAVAASIQVFVSNTRGIVIFLLITYLSQMYLVLSNLVFFSVDKTEALHKQSSLQISSSSSAAASSVVKIYVLWTLILSLLAPLS